MYFLNLFAHF